MVANDGSLYVTTGNQNLPVGRMGTLYPSFVWTVGHASGTGRLHPIPPSTNNYWTATSGGRSRRGLLTFNGVATPMVGACNKNGTYYALNAGNLAAGPVWEDHIGSVTDDDTDCIAAAVWDQASGQLFLAGNDTTIGGTHYNGSIEQVDPATGAPIWQRGLPGAVMGSPTLNGSGVLAVGTTDFTGVPDAAYLLNASNGQVLSTINTGGAQVFAQPVFSNSYLLVATGGQGLWAYLPSAISTRS